MTEISGSCLCGNVSYKGDADVKMVMNCHCNDCQQATGSVHGTMLFVAEDEIEISGSLKDYSHPADSGNTLTKFFCGDCGSQLFGKNTGRAGMIGIRGGSIAQKELVTPSANIYCESAIPSTPMAEGVKQFPKMPG